MSYHGQPVGPRVPKDEFMRALNLRAGDPTHENHYRSMREAAIRTYSRMNDNRGNLIDEKRYDSSCQPPFFWHHIHADARHRGIIETWHDPETSNTVAGALFNLGQTSGEHGPNWVTLWLLYSVFRSRDFRNNRNRRNGDDRRDGGGPHQDPGPSSGGGGGGGGDTKYYDPARDPGYAHC